MHYRNEQTFSFEKYITALLQNNFQILACYNLEPYDEEDEVRALLNGIHVLSQEFGMCVLIARSCYHFVMANQKSSVYTLDFTFD